VTQGPWQKKIYGAMTWLWAGFSAFCPMAKAQTLSFQSLMLSPSEQSALEKITGDEQQAHSEDDAETLTLDAIMFFDANRWTFWLNQHPITPNTIPSHMRVHFVNETQVSFSLKGSAEHITLCPHEKYTGKKNSVSS
jgi:hypothetical protein